MSDFEALAVDAGEARIAVRRGGSGAPVLLLHGFPQTSLMWRDIAPLLASRFTIVCADLRGYGGSGCPPSAPDHVPYSKRAMAQDMIVVMETLGFERFAVVGHDRGGRVAYRMALDHPERVERLAVLDVVPIDSASDRADDRLALGFWPWSLLAQAEPLPERLVGGAPDAVIDHALSPEWGTPSETFDRETRAQYLAQLRDGQHLHAICEEYRAAAGVDRKHDAADREADRQIRCPLRAQYAASWCAGGEIELGADFDAVARLRRVHAVTALLVDCGRRRFLPGQARRRGGGTFTMRGRASSTTLSRRSVRMVIR